MGFFVRLVLGICVLVVDVGYDCFWWYEFVINNFNVYCMFKDVFIKIVVFEY